MAISLTEVTISEDAIHRVTEVLRSGRIGQGKVVEEFEQLFADWIGSKYAIAVSSGTMADTIALAILKYTYPGRREVILPALTFAAHLNSIIYNNLTPVFVDHGKQESKPGPNTLCEFPVHLLGHPTQIVLSGKVPAIEDACEAMGSRFLGKKLGTLYDIGTFSFFPSHTMTTGEGGMIVTDNKAYYELARRLRNHGKDNTSDFHFSIVGFNGKMTSICAALGIEALKNIDSVIEKRRSNYIQLGGDEPTGCYISPHAFPVICKKESERDRIMNSLNQKGIENRNFFSSLPTQEKAYSFLGHQKGQFPVAEAIGNLGLYVPCHQYLTASDLVNIKETIYEKEKTKREMLV